LRRVPGQGIIAFTMGGIMWSFTERSKNSLFLECGGRHRF